jgi:hypothetical protein
MQTISVKLFKIGDMSCSAKYILEYKVKFR